MSSETIQPNSFTHAPLGATLARTALPIIFVMSMNGLLTVADAVFLGLFVGPDALSAVTLMFPAYMLIVALATLVGSGMSSRLARQLGGGQFDEARATFAGAHGLAWAVSAVLIIVFLLFGRSAALLAAHGSVPLAEMGHTYLAILILSTPVTFLLSVHADALRNEGRVGLMAAMSLFVSLANIALNYVLIVQMGLGVAGSAYGTVAAQFLAVAIIIGFRVKGRTALRPSVLLQHRLTTAWSRMLALGAPQSLGFLGMALISASILAALQWAGTPHYEETVSAYGITTRIMTFVFLPLLGLSHALQSIIGNNYGAGLWDRSNGALRLGLATAFVYCLTAEILLVRFAYPIGLFFVDEAPVAGEVARILPVMVTLYFLAGPLMIIGTYFQAIGDAARAALLSLSKPYLFSVPLVLALPLFAGERGIWMASPIAEALLLTLTIAVLSLTAKRRVFAWGLFRS